MPCAHCFTSRSTASAFDDGPAVGLGRRLGSGDREQRRRAGTSVVLLARAGALSREAASGGQRLLERLEAEPIHPDVDLYDLPMYGEWTDTSFWNDSRNDPPSARLPVIASAVNACAEERVRSAQRRFQRTSCRCPSRKARFMRRFAGPEAQRMNGARARVSVDTSGQGEIATHLLHENTGRECSALPEDSRGLANAGRDRTGVASVQRHAMIRGIRGVAQPG